MKEWSGWRLGIALAAVLGPVARACTVCDSATAQQMRAGLFNGHFVETAMLVLVPFPVLGLTVLGLRWVVPRLLEREG